MKWQANSKTNLPPRGVKLDIIVTGRGRPKRLTNCTYMAALEVFRTEMNVRHIPFKEVSHWQVVTIPGDNDTDIETVEDCVDLLREANNLCVQVLQDGIKFLPGQDKRDVAYQLRGVTHHIMKATKIILTPPTRPDNKWEI